jgi:uncharacterized RDD family membrane protein YckC
MGNKVPTFKRTLAFIIDFLLVAVLSSLIIYFIPHSTNYEKTLVDTTELRSKLSDKSLSNDDFIKINTELTYNSYKYGVVESSITIVLMISYFACFTYFANGETIGKKLLKIRVVSLDDKKPSFLSAIIRSFLITRTFGDIITLSLALILKKNAFVSSYKYIDMFITIVWIMCPIIAIWREDGRGLHDLLAGTKVVDKNLDKRKLPQKEEKVLEAEVEEKEIKEEAKKSTKKSTKPKSNKKK